MTHRSTNNGQHANREHSSAHIQNKAWGNLLVDLAPERAHAKPRRRGLTMILDRCQGLAATTDLLEMVGEYVDHVKLSFGTSVLLSEAFICRKNELIRAHNIDVYPGGTLAEVMLVQGAYAEYLKRAKVLGFTAIEVSDGTITMSRQVRRAAIKRALDAGFKVISEVGKKDSSIEIPVAQLCDQICDDLALGVDNVIVEARESGAGIGIYDAGGAIREDKLAAMLAQLRGHEDAIMWEAPRTGQQAQLIMHGGPNVSLGNVKPRDVLGLEALRCGLRYETFRQFSPLLEAQDSLGDSDE
jgi:phosphosulfolactate synthase